VVKTVAMAFVILTICTFGSAHAATIEQVFTNSWSTGYHAAGWGYQGFGLFDGSLGILNEVTISINTTLFNVTPNEGIKVRSDFYTSVGPVN
jgi:hypothetical protein